METVNLNLAHRWFIGYDLDESVPDHNSLSKIRERFGLGVFQLFFERIVELCMRVGLAWGDELYCDSTKVQANANLNWGNAMLGYRDHYVVNGGKARILFSAADTRFDHGQHTLLDLVDMNREKEYKDDLEIRERSENRCHLKSSLS